MALTIAKASLLSRTVRSGLSQNGTRKIDLDMTFAEQGEGIVEKIFDIGRQLVGFITNLPSLVSNIRVSATAIFGWLVATTTSISQFDWNATDTELRAAIDARNVALSGVWGGVVGTTFGQLAPVAIGAGIAFVLPVVGGPGLAAAVIASSLPEAVEEIWGSFRNALYATAAIKIQNLATWGYINIRKLIKSAPTSVLETLFGASGATWIKTVWGSESAPRLTFADTLEDKIESVKDPSLRAFTEELADEFFDSFIESGFVVAQSLDQAIAEAKKAQAEAKGPQRTVLIKPDKRTPELAYAVTGTEDEVKEQIQQTINDHRKIAAKDVGQIVGMPAEDWYRAKIQRRKLTLVFKELPRPPYYRRERGIKESCYTIPEPKTNLSWERIKRACKPYTWGKYRCTANLNNGRQMAVYGASPEIAEEKLRELLDLSTAEIITLSITEEKDRNPKLRKEATRMYPATGTMLVRRPALDTVGRTDLDGNTWDDEHIRFDLWTDDEPEEFQFVRFGVGDNAD